VIVFLRFVGIVNASIWFGGAIVFTFAVAPSFFSPQMKSIFGDIYTGVIAQIALERYFHLFYWCGVIALVHQLAEWILAARPLQRLTLIAFGGAFCLGLVGGLWLQPTLKSLFVIKNAQPGLYAAAEQARAAKKFSVLHGVAQVSNLLALTGLLIFHWRVTNPPPGPRFITSSKFRS